MDEELASQRPPHQEINKINEINLILSHLIKFNNLEFDKINNNIKIDLYKI
jgi:hypothetical protein